MLHRVTSNRSGPQAMWNMTGGTVVGCVCHARADSRNPLTGVVVQHTSVSGLEKGAKSASVCGMSVLCLNRVRE